ncbi:MAG TPA: hypothetical protein VMQ65_01680 [Candidatus Limnocylindria bacterium]|nr:hypothetical protein [Candidatus Limnocylindria bacterium]
MRATPSVVLARALAALALLVVVGCAPEAGPTFGPASPGPTIAPTPTLAPAPSPSFAPTGSAAVLEGVFAFDAESILGYYETLGYSCGPAQPSTQAVGHMVRACTLIDADGRQRLVSIVTDPAGDVADALTSIEGTAAEPILDPVVALEPFAAFLGAALGESQGESLLPWLASHLGDEFATTTLGDLTIATYTQSPQDHSTLYLEIANRAFLESPTPSGP